MKVGVTYNYKQRAKQLERVSPFEIRLSLVVADSDPLTLEVLALREFKEFRIKGEWFHAKPSSAIDATKCTYREFIFDLSREARLLEQRLRDFLIDNADGGVVYGG